MADSWRAIVEEALQIWDGNQAALARQLNRGASVIGCWRRGIYKPDFESCLALADITHRSPDDVLIAAGHDPSLLRVVRRTEQAPGRSHIDAQRQLVRDQLDSWLDAVGPDYEEYFWKNLRAQGDSTAQFIQELRTAVSADRDAAVSDAVSGPHKPRRRPRNSGGPPLGAHEHATTGLLANRRDPASYGRALVLNRRAA